MSRRLVFAVLVLIVTGVGLGATVPSASADDCPEGWVCGVTAPPIPPDQAGDPQPVTIDWTRIPDVPAAVTYPGPALPAPKHCQKKAHGSATSKSTCKKKHRK